MINTSTDEKNEQNTMNLADMDHYWPILDKNYVTSSSLIMIYFSITNSPTLQYYPTHFQSIWPELLKEKTFLEKKLCVLGMFSQISICKVMRTFEQILRCLYSVAARVFFCEVETD